MILHEQETKIAGQSKTVEFVVIHEKWTNAVSNFKGRLVFHAHRAGALMELCKRAVQIKAVERSIECGSDATKKLGIEVGHLSFDFKDGSYLTFNDTSVLSGGYAYQPSNGDLFDPACRRWGDVSTVIIKRAKTAQPVPA